MAKIVTVPSDILRKLSLPVLALDNRVLNILTDMEKTLKAAKNPEGVGLAAPQIGIPLRIFMIRPVSKGSITTFINPEIIKFSQRQNIPTGKKGVYEGCLSIPDHYAPIKRSMSVTIKYQAIKSKILNSNNQINSKNKIQNNLDLRISDLEFESKTEIFSGFAAHVIQHEMDHLNGILFIDRCLEQNSKLYKVDGEEWEEVGI